MSDVLHMVSPGRLTFKCPGCNDTHTVNVGDGPGARWGWNGDSVKPTFTPSILARSGHYISEDSCWCKFYQKHSQEAEEEGDDRFTCYLCHSFVTDGRIQFLDDCTHSLAGQTVELQPWQ